MSIFNTELIDIKTEKSVNFMLSKNQSVVSVEWQLTKDIVDKLYYC